MNRNLVIIALLLIFVGALGVLFTWNDYVSYDRITDEASIHAGNIDEIYVLNNIADVDIKPSPDEYIHVLWKGKTIGNEISSLETSVKDNVLTIDLKRKGVFRFININIQFFLSNLEIYIPKKEIGDLIVEHDIGRLKVNNLLIENIHVQTSVSDVYVEDVLSLTTHLESSLGDIVVKNSEGEFNIKNDIGNIEFSGSNPKGNITAQTDLGDIILQIGNKENASIYATSDLGDVTIYGSNIESFVVKEANYIVDVKTNIGDIKVSTY